MSDPERDEDPMLGFLFGNVDEDNELDEEYIDTVSHVYLMAGFQVMTWLNALFYKT